MSIHQQPITSVEDLDWMDKWRRENHGLCLPCGGVGGEYTPGEGFSGTCEACSGTGRDDSDASRRSEILPDDGQAAPTPGALN